MSDDFMENIDGLISDNSDSSDLSDYDESSSSPKSNVDSSSYDERYAEEYTLHMGHLSEDIRKNRAAIRFQKFNTLESLCVATIICHQEYFVNYAEQTETNPIDELPTSLRKLMLQSAWRNAPEIKIYHKPEAERETLIRRKLFVNLLIYPGVLVLNGPNVCSQMTEGDFWRTMVKEGADTLQRVSFDHTPKLPSDHYRLFLLKLEKLRIIKIPNFHCTNKQLESIAVRLPCLQELSNVKLMTLDGADYTSSLNALSKLKALEKFIFSYQDQRRTNNDNFMDECLRKFPSLKYVGNELPMYNISDYIIPHNFHIFKKEKEIVRFGFEQIVVYHYIPENCYLPNLQGISLICHLYSNHQGIAKFTNVTELGFFGDCYGSPDILQIMGNQLTTLRMCLTSVCVSFILNCCKKLKYLYISVQHVENSDELWSPESIKNLETFVFKAEMQLSLPNLFLYRVMQAPNLKFLEIYNTIMRIDETKQAISDVQNGTILQNLVKFRFHRIKMFQHIDDYSATLVRKLLVCCAAYCPKLIEASLGHCNIVDGVLGPELMRMESLCSSM